MAKILRDSLFINSILLNSEVWYNLSKSNIEDLEKLDNILLKKICEIPTTAPSAFLHLELGTVPIRFILKTRRLLFLQYILQEEENSLLNKFLVAQIMEPKAGDWWLSILEDMEDFNLTFTNYEIKNMKKEVFKKKVKHAASEAAFKWLNGKKAELKKMKDIQYKKLEIQDYLLSPSLSTHQTKFLLQLRSRMLPLRTNYHKMYKDDNCPLCSLSGQGERFSDSQQHLLSCNVLSSDTDINEIDLRYSDIFGSDVNKQSKMTILLSNKYKKRKHLEEKSN